MGATLLQSGLLVIIAVALRHLFAAIGLATVIAAGLDWDQRAQAPDAVLGRVAWGDGIHGTAQTKARGGDGGGGAEMWDSTARTEEGGGDKGRSADMRNRAARMEARGGGGGGGGEMRD